MDGCPGVGVAWDKVALQTNLCDRALAPMYIHRTGKTSGGRGGAELLFLFRGHCEMVSSRGWSGSGTLLVDSWLGSIAALVWQWCVLVLTPAVLGAEGVARIGQVWGVVSAKSLKNHWRWVYPYSLRSSEPFGNRAGGQPNVMSEEKDCVYRVCIAP